MNMLKTNRKIYKVIEDIKEKEILESKMTITKIFKTSVVSTTEWREKRKE